MSAIDATTTMVVSRSEPVDSSTSMRVPGDKAVAQRAMVLAALADGTTVIDRWPACEDTMSAIDALAQLGAGLDRRDDRLTVQGCGLRGLSPRADTVDAGNSATLARLLLALGAGRVDRRLVVTGNALLRRRPMEWVAEPLRDAGANVDCLEAAGRLPIAIGAHGPLSPLRVTAAVRSAQAKSSLLYASLFASGASTISARTLVRDHTERLMAGFGIPIANRGRTSTITPVPGFAGRQLPLPGDVSAAAPLVAAAVVRPEPVTVTIEGVGLNPTRTGFLAALQRMGADVTVSRRGQVGQEPVGTVTARGGRRLRGTTVFGPAFVQSMIDEVPLLVAVAACAEGETRVRDCGELAVKDTDRLATTAAALRPFGVSVKTGTAEVTVHGGYPLAGAEVDSHGDHRVAMATAVLASTLASPTRIHRAGAVSVSFPGFFRELRRLANIHLDEGSGLTADIATAREVG